VANLSIDDATAQLLQARAAAQGLTVDQYVRTLVEPGRTAPRLSLDEFDAALQELCFDGPTLPADFSRSDIYSDHD
jgi:hypothetical protein